MLSPRTHFYQLFDWIKWDEQKIEKTLFEEYNWEISPDTTTTWRIGDGTAAFYNYIYYTVAGFSEFDTFRSNQIREGLITREAGLNFIAQENRPRFESMKWYFETIGVDLEHAIKVVNSIPKLYNLI
jgi:glucosamine--fructose-6-phosphate aminotransferase (isomerizing)